MKSRPRAPSERRPGTPAPYLGPPCLGALCLAAFACQTGARSDAGSVSARSMADAVHAVLEADRIVYTREVVNRLQNELGLIQATERWKEDKTLPLPAQMFRMGAEQAASKTEGLHYALISTWAINRQNQPRTDKIGRASCRERV